MDNRRLTNADMAEIKKRAEAATEGPWNKFPIVDNDEFVVIGGDMVAETVYEEADATFIAHARQDVPALLAEVERLRKALEDVVYEQYEIGAGFVATKTLEIVKEALRNEQG